MSQAPLQTLETLRRQAVDAAQRRVAEARTLCAEAEARLHEALAEQAKADARLQQARQEFAAARSVLALRCAEAHLCGVERDLTTQAAQVVRLQACCAASRAGLARETEALSDAERARRALSQVLDARREAAEKRRERVEEDQVEDALRVLRAGRPLRP